MAISNGLSDCSSIAILILFTAVLIWVSKPLLARGGKVCNVLGPRGNIYGDHSYLLVASPER
jgi:hypothetical protein